LEIGIRNFIPEIKIKGAECRTDASKQSFVVTTRNLSNDDAGESILHDDAPTYAPISATGSRVYPPATQSPSGIDWGEINKEDVKAMLLATIGDRLPMHTSPDMANFGNAMHGFLAADGGDNASSRMEMANRMLGQWEVAGAIDPADMLRASDRLKQFIGEHYPNAQTLNEWPMTMVLANHQRMQGWIDMLLELPEGYIVVDHKSFPGPNPVEHAKVYAPQLNIYKQAVGQATGRPVLATLIHMPIQGVVIQI